MRGCLPHPSFRQVDDARRGTQLHECQHVYHQGTAFQNEDQRTVLVARAGPVNGRVIKKVGPSFEVMASENSDLEDVVWNMHEVSVEFCQRLFKPDTRPESGQEHARDLTEFFTWKLDS